MEDQGLGFIDDFIEIETYINNGTFETSHYTGIKEFFSEHLNSSNIDEKIKIEGINFFRVEVGDRVAISPSSWTMRFREKHNLEEDYSDYKEYTIENIRVEYSTKDGRSDSGLPKMQIILFLSK